MNFFRITARQDFANYSAENVRGPISDARIIPPHREIVGSASEYLGVPQRRPGKQGHFHTSANAVFVKEPALDLMGRASKSQLLAMPAVLRDREGEEFHQVWVLNFVDCLDLGKTIASPSSGFYKNKIGVIKRPVFDEQKWDGSDLFVVPQDPSYCLFCTEAFLTQWKEGKLRGAMFSRFLMDPEAIRC